MTEILAFHAYVAGTVKLLYVVVATILNNKDFKRTAMFITDISNAIREAIERASEIY